MALLPLAACGGGGGGGNPEDAAIVDADPNAPDADPTRPDAKPGPDAPTPDAAQANCTPVRGTKIAVELVATVDGATPLLLTSPPGDPRLFVVQQDGKIAIVKDGEALGTAFLDITDKVNDETSEQGLLGLAFHPDYRSNRKFYVYYTADGTQNLEYDNVIEEYQASADNPDVAVKTSVKPVLRIPDPEWNHNGGMMEFGPDGQLWVATGDGGDGGARSQRDSDLLGKVLRIDVNAASPQATVWAKGLRNPWRWSFDAMTKELYIADVGQNTFEEVNVVASNATGLNFGWNPFEANTGPDNQRAGKTFPVVVHTQGRADNDGEWEAIIGGGVYRGSCFPDIQGTYFYSDNNVGELWSFKWQGGRAEGDARVLANSAFVDNPTSLHADAFGELYVTGASGDIRRIIVTP